jgi:hypothetical protein
MAVNLGIVPSQKSTSREFRADYTGDGESNVADRMRALLETLGRLSRRFARLVSDQA